MQNYSKITSIYIKNIYIYNIYYIYKQYTYIYQWSMIHIYDRCRNVENDCFLFFTYHISHNWSDHWWRIYNWHNGFERLFSANRDMIVLAKLLHWYKTLVNVSTSVKLRKRLVVAKVGKNETSHENKESLFQNMILLIIPVHQDLWKPVLLLSVSRNQLKAEFCNNPIHWWWTEEYSEPYETSAMEHFVKIVNGRWKLTFRL